MAKTRVVLAFAFTVLFVMHSVSADSNPAPSPLEDTKTSWVDWARNKFSGMLNSRNSKNPTEEVAPPSPAPSPSLWV